MIAENTYERWRAFVESGVRGPESETDYLDLVRLADDLTGRYDINQQPWEELFGLVAGYMHEWEMKNEPELKNPEVEPRIVLAELLEEHGVSQYQLASEGIADQGNLSKILAGERGISKALAKKLAVRFKVSADLFL
ncbi:MAG: helix-turn-helix domain-containing protein [Trueperaceae bacterium]